MRKARQRGSDCLLPAVDIAVCASLRGIAVLYRAHMGVSSTDQHINILNQSDPSYDSTPHSAVELRYLRCGYRIEQLRGARKWIRGSFARSASKHTICNAAADWSGDVEVPALLFKLCTDRGKLRESRGK